MNSWQRVPWDFAYLCWANPFILNFGHLRRLTLLTGLCAAVLAGVLPIDVLQLDGFDRDIASLHDCLLERVVLRKTRPDLERQFRTPMGAIYSCRMAGRRDGYRFRLQL